MALTDLEIQQKVWVLENSLKTLKNSGDYKNASAKAEMPMSIADWGSVEADGKVTVLYGGEVGG